MATTPARPIQSTPPAKPSEREGNVRRPAAAPKTRAQRFAEAHEKVLDQHGETFAKLAT
jgi:hypothetical protein